MRLRDDEAGKLKSIPKPEKPVVYASFVVKTLRLMKVFLMVN